MGVYRLWRDSGYAVGGVMAGTLADAFGMRAAIGAVAVLTALSGLLVAGADAGDACRGAIRTALTPEGRGLS